MTLWAIFIFYLGEIKCQTKIIGATFLDLNEADITGGILTIYGNKKDVVLFGESLTLITQISFTHVYLEHGSVCTDRFPVNYSTQASGDSHTKIFSYYKSSFIPEDTNLYLCALIEGSQAFIHQGGGVVMHSSHSNKLMPVWLSYLVVVILIIMSGMFSGLNLGLMSLTPRELNLIISTGTAKERKSAKQVLPIRKKGNVLLCAILFGNTIVNSSTAIILEDVTSGIISVLVTTIIIVIFGEVIPQSICARYGLLIGAKTRYFTWLVLLLTFPISYPLGKLLDRIVGYETPIVYNRHQLLEVVRLNCAGNLEEDEAGIIFGALKFKSKSVYDIMTPLEECFMVDEHSVLDFKTISEIIKSGYSRIPVYSETRNNIVALLHIKDLAFIDPDDMIPLISVLNFYNHPLIKVFHDTKIDLVFKEFKKGLAHLGIVIKIKYQEGFDPVYESIGIVTLEDIIEEIIQSEISDETDVKPYAGATKYEISKNFTKHHIRQFFESTQSSIPELTPNIILTVCQFMSTALEVFHPDKISINILRKLISHPGVAVKRDYVDDYYLYKSGVPADYFVLIIEGRTEVTIGSENLTFVQGPFSYYGYGAIEKIDSTTIKSPYDKAKFSFFPDFSLKILSDVFFIKINYSLYKIAMEATALEKAMKQSGEPSDDLWEKMVIEPHGSETEQPSPNIPIDKPDVIIITNLEPKPK